MNTPLTDRFQDLDREALIALARKERYFHNMRLAGIDTGSWVYENNLPQNYHLYPTFQYLNELSVAGATCLDIGTYDGMTAFSLAVRGAARVDATCTHELNRFRIARALGGYRNIAYFPKTDLDSIHSGFDAGRYDLVVMTAMLHHLLSPLEGLLEARRLLKPQGFILVEAIVREGEASQIQLNTALDDPVYGTPTIWLMSPGAVLEMLRFACLDPVSWTQLIGTGNARESNYGRLTVLARASSPGKVAGRKAKLEELHANVPQLGRYRFADFDVPDAPQSGIGYAGPGGQRYLNIWKHRPADPLQPAWNESAPGRSTLFRIAENRDFSRLVKKYPNGAFNTDDLRLLPAKYPGQVMPDGMRWGLKQLGNLHVLDYITTWGLQSVLEIGPGFNLYFPNHLPPWCDYTAIDDDGFYDPGLLAMADALRKRGRRVRGLLGKNNAPLPRSSFDACFSISTLEHIPAQDIQAACREMFDLLVPGGWALHTIDLARDQVRNHGGLWLDALARAGFLLDAGAAQLDEAKADRPFGEPLSLVLSFFSGYKENVWGNPLVNAGSQVLTVLVAARKPPENAPGG